MMGFLVSAVTMPDDVATVVRLELSVEIVEPEGYGLRVEPGLIHLTGGTSEGLGHAIQTLKQLFPSNAFSSVPFVESAIANCVISDQPTLEWRGGMLDVSRHFFPKRSVLRLIDTMAAHKYNRLQLHLTDDQGWRIESLRYPLLTSRGAVRAESQTTHYDDEPAMDGTPHGGFYTQADIKEIVAHAQERGIVIVPEIEFPGHTGALLASYPAWGSPQIAREVGTKWGIFDSLVSPLPEIEEHIKNLLSEVLELFPSPWIHMGGDEGLISRWLEDPPVVQHMRAKGLETSRELFTDFMGRISAWLAENGRTMITWDDAFANDPTGAAPGVVMAWRGTEVARRAADLNFDVVLSPVVPTYFDYYQAEDTREPLAIGGPITLQDVAEFDPLSASWGESALNNVLGTQFQVWTELIPSERHLDYMTWPRACVLAEVAWTGAPVPTHDLTERLLGHLPRLDAMGVEYRPLDGPRPWQEGGLGSRRHRPSKSMAEKRAALNRAAEDGDVAFTPLRGVTQAEETDRAN
jgi:hexosaminidase